MKRHDLKNKEPEFQGISDGIAGGPNGITVLTYTVDETGERESRHQHAEPCTSAPSRKCCPQSTLLDGTTTMTLTPMTWLAKMTMMVVITPKVKASA